MPIHVNEFGQPIGFPLLDWKPPPDPSREPMQGRFCRVEILDPEIHAADLFRAYSLNPDGRNWTYLSVGPFAQFPEYQAWLRDVCGKPDPLFHAIVDLATGKAVGAATYLRITPSIGSIEVGHINFSPRLRRSPAATEAMFLMMRRVFQLGYRRYEWKCDSLNAPSRAAAMRLGFSFEGVFRQATVYKGRNRDTAWYAMIDQEWPRLEAAFARWLDPNNFDNDGNQRTRLSELTAPILKQRG